MKTAVFLCILLILGMTPNLFAQELECEIEVKKESVDQLTAEARDNLQDFGQQIKQYINSQRWTRKDFGDTRIRCRMQISFGGATSPTHYTAQVIVISQRPVNNANKNTAVIRLKDDKWEFDYIRAQPLQRDEYRFDPLLSFLDYYAYTIIGYDQDTYSIGDGTPYFEKAYEIFNKARGSGAGTKGWESQTENAFSRQKLVEETLSPKFGDFRVAFYRYFYKGLDYLAQKPEKGRKTILKALKSIADLQHQINQQSLIINLFFETKSPEIAEIFKNAPEPGVLEELIQYDPQHRQVYETAFNGR